MNDTTRRRFLAMAGTSAAAAGAAAVLPGSIASGAAEPAGSLPDGTDSGPYVAYVENLHSGEVSVMVGDQEVTVIDRDLATRIARLGGSAA